MAPNDLRSPRTARQLPSLTPLRGIAAIWVVLYHYTFQYFPNLNSEVYTHLVQKGYLAVDMFFLLSGFVLTHVYHDAFSADAANNYWNFLKARIARLYPLHLLVLLLFVATALTSRIMEYVATGRFKTIPLAGPESFTALLANLFMLQGLQASSLSWNYPAWSISVEFLAYLGFPFALPAIWRANAASKITLAMALFGALGWLAYLTRDNFNQWDGPLTLLRCLPEFVIGTLLYDVFRSRICAPALTSDGVALGVSATGILLLHLGAPDLTIVPIFAVLILALVANTGKAAALLNMRPFIWLGNISYSLYLIHGFVQYITTEVLQGLGYYNRQDLSEGSSLALLLVMVSVCLLVATMTYQGVEVTGRRYLRTLLGVWRTRAARKRSQRLLIGG